MKLLLRLSLMLSIIFTTLIILVSGLGQIFPGTIFSFTSKISMDLEDNRDIYLMDWVRVVKVNITKNNSLNSEPVWSPNGQKIAFETNRDGHYQIYIDDLVNQITSNLSQSPYDDRFPSWSPNGRYIAFWSRPTSDPPSAISGEPWRIHIADLDTGILLDLPYVVDSITNNPFIWSPKSRYLTFSAYLNQGSEIYVYDMNTHLLRNISNHPSEDRYPAWSPDEKQLSFSSQRGGSDKNQIYIGDVENGDLHLFSSADETSDFLSAWSPNGQDLAITSLNELDIRDVITGRSVLPVIQFANRRYLPKWSLDGQYILMQSDQISILGSGGIYLLNTKSGELREIVQTKGFGDNLGDWIPQ